VALTGLTFFRPPRVSVFFPGTFPAVSPSFKKRLPVVLFVGRIAKDQVDCVCVLDEASFAYVSVGEHRSVRRSNPRLPSLRLLTLDFLSVLRVQTYFRSCNFWLRSLGTASGSRCLAPRLSCYSSVLSLSPSPRPRPFVNFPLTSRSLTSRSAAWA